MLYLCPLNSESEVCVWCCLDCLTPLNHCSALCIHWERTVVGILLCSAPHLLPRHQRWMASSYCAIITTAQYKKYKCLFLYFDKIKNVLFFHRSTLQKLSFLNLKANSLALMCGVATGHTGSWSVSQKNDTFSSVSKKLFQKNVYESNSNKVEDITVYFLKNSVAIQVLKLKYRKYCTNIA